ncbi:hypothetical protein Tco_1501245 [Tanacetum coccineum]
MSTLAEFMILFGADNRPPMLEKHLYDSWKSIMELYMKNREHGRIILESVEHDPLIWPTIEENGVTRTKKYEELSTTEKIQADFDLKATNIILQGLPSDVYYLVNHHRVAKDLWEIVQLLMQAISSQYQVLNSLQPEWSKFVTDVKLVRDLHTTIFDQLHAYLKQHELHANEVRILMYEKHVSGNAKTSVRGRGRVKVVTRESVEGKEYPFDLSKPLPLIMVQGRQVIPVDYFINNDLEYLREGSSSKKYTTSMTKTKAAKYDILGIEDMVPSLWNPVKVAYDRYGVWGITHWGPKRQRIYGFASNMVSKYDVYFTKRIIAATKVKVMKWYDYGYLEEIEVRREDHQLYKFKEGDFPRLHLYDIEDMMLLLVQNKLFNLETDVILTWV